MLRNYLRTSLRHLVRNKQFTVINISGLAVGIAASLIILFYVRHELAYDRFVPEHERIFRIGINVANGQHPMTWLQMPHGEMLAKEHSDVVEAVVRFQVRKDRLFAVGDKQFYGETVAYADPNVFDVFGYPLIHGNPRSVLQSQESIVLSESMAKKYFGDENPVGHIMSLDRTMNFIVSGVMADLPSYTHLKFDCLLNIERLPNVWRRTHDAWTYVKVRPGVRPSVLQERSVQIYKKYLNERVPGSQFIVQPLADIHLGSHLDGEPEINSDMSLVWTLVSIAGLILIMGCMNYVNLATAQAMNRFKEVGVRKVLGADRMNLVRQFLVESFTIVGIATTLGVLLAELAMPSMGQWIGKDFSGNVEGEFPAWMIPAIIFITVSLLSGIYPTVFMACQDPVTVLKGEIRRSARLGFRKILLVVQFAITVILMVGTWVAYRQLEFIRNKPLGFEKDHLINLTVRDVARWRMHTETLRSELLRVPGVVHAAAAAFFISELEVEGSALKPKGASDDDFRIMDFIKCDAHFPSTLGLSLAAGREFSNQRAGDSTGGFMLNETAVRLFNWTPEEAVGKKVAYNNWHTGEIVGVVRDFHFTSVQNEIRPFAFLCWPAIAMRYGTSVHMTLRIADENVQSTLKGIEKKMAELSPEFPVEMAFVNASLDHHFRQDRITGSLFGLFAVLAILIACLGLFGLTAYTIRQRTKEIGIRKVLGASIPRLLLDLSFEYLVLIGFAAAMAIPAAYLWMREWRAQYAYRAPESLWPYALTLVVLAAIATLTMSYQALRAARANPVDSLKYE